MSFVVTPPEYNIRRATAVVEVVVLDINYELSKHNIPFAMIRLKVVDCIVGESPDMIVVRRPFVTPDLEFLHTHIIPSYAIGERFITTIESSNSVYSLLVLHNGKFTVERGIIAGTTVSTQAFKEQILQVRTGAATSLPHSVPRHNTDLRGSPARLTVQNNLLSPCEDGIEYLDGDFWAWDFTWRETSTAARLRYNPSDAPYAAPIASAISNLANLSYAMWTSHLSTFMYSN